MRCSKKCARPDLPGVSSADPTRYQSMCVTTGARWSGINTTCRPFESWNIRASNSPADAKGGAPVLAAKTNTVGASLRQITWHPCPLVRGLRIIALLLLIPYVGHPPCARNSLRAAIQSLLNKRLLETPEAIGIPRL